MRDLTGLSDGKPAASTSIVPIASELRDLAAHLSQQRDVILHAWQDAVARDSGLPVGITARNQPAQENVYSLLVSFEWALRHLVKLQEKHSASKAMRKAQPTGTNVGSKFVF